MKTLLAMLGYYYEVAYWKVHIRPWSASKCERIMQRADMHCPTPHLHLLP